jgi:hypothetical protein
MRPRLIIVLLFAVSLAGCVPTAAIAPAPAIHAAAPSPTAVALADLWLDVSLGPPLVDWFQEVAQPNDIARVEHPSQAGLLEPIANARRLVVFKSLRDMQRALEIMGDVFDIIGYNLESGPATPPDEQANPVEAVKFIHEIAAQSGKLLAVGPDRNFALTYGPQIAPYVDIFVIQVQRIQTESDLVREYVVPLAAALREANPDIQISVQVRTEGDVVALADMIESLAADLDGVSILTSPETVDVAEALVAEIRSRTAAVVPSPAPASPTSPRDAAPSVRPTVLLTASPNPGVTPSATLTTSLTPLAAAPTEAPPSTLAPVPPEETTLRLPPRAGAALAAALLVGAGFGALLVALIVRAIPRG